MFDLAPDSKHVRDNEFEGLLSVAGEDRVDTPVVDVSYSPFVFRLGRDRVVRKELRPDRERTPSLPVYETEGLLPSKIVSHDPMIGAGSPPY